MTNHTYFIDANVPMYAVGVEHPMKRPCLAILESIARNELQAVTNVEVLQEILHRYTSLGERVRAIEVAELFLRVMPDVLPVTREDFALALKIHGEYPALQARDSVHAAVMQNHSITNLISADRHFDSLPQFHRLDPLSWPMSS